jgi:hypothetical protein
LYKKTEKTTVKNFAKLLNGYLCLQDQWAILCKKHEKTLYLQNAEYSEPATTESYLLLSWPKYRQEEWVESLGGVRYHYDRLSSRINIEKPETLLKASSKFNVEAAKIGSMFDPGRIIPSSFEDMFTLFHQNLLTCQSVINNDLGLTIEILPAFVKNICDMLPKKGTPLPPIYKNSYISKTIMNCGVEFIGLKVSRTHITVHFNIPMRQHSGILRVICNTRKPEETKIFLEFMGHNEHNRWEHFAAFASFIACAFGIKETQRAQAKISKEAGEKEGASSVSFEWIIGKNGLSKEISLCLYDLISHTTDGINFNEEIFTYASGLKYNEDLDIKKSTFGKSFSSEKPFLIDEKIFLNKFPEFLDENKVPKEWFGYNLFLNDTFMQIFYDNKNYNRALDVIEMTIQQMIKTADFSYKKRIQFLDVYSKYGGYLFDYCLLYLGKIMALHNNDTTQRVEKILNDIINALRKSEVILADKENYERYKTIYKKIDGHYFFNVFYRNWFNKSDYNELMKTITNGLFQLFANANFKEFYLELFLQDPMNSIVYSLSDMNDFKGAYTWLIQPDIVEKIIQTIEDLRLYKNDKIFIEKMEKNLSKGKKSIEENIDYICKKLIGLIYQEYESQNKIDKVPQIVLDIVKKYKIKG